MNRTQNLITDNTETNNTASLFIFPTVLLKNNFRFFFNITLALICLIFCFSLNGQNYKSKQLQEINITPKPSEIILGKGKFVLEKHTNFVTTSDSLQTIAAFFSAKINRATGYKTKVVKNKFLEKSIYLNIDNSLPLNQEGYHLVSDINSIKITAKSSKGIFYGMQTLLQLLPAEIESNQRVQNIKWTIPAVTISDEPSFGYRGMHLDVCRHFFDLDFIKKQLDIMAMFKLNKFHWHLTDDQAWRIEIKKYPKLTTIGSKRIEGDGTTYGPYYYTQDQIREVVDYAKERFIEVIPEIEMPGHAVAALTAYPELSCNGGPLKVINTWGIFEDVFCAGNEATFDFISDVLSEVAVLFESPLIHIGGDECPKVRWKSCPKCQFRIRELGLKDDAVHSAEEKLQGYFISRVENILSNLGKRAIGWEEIMDGNPETKAVLMSWRGEEAGIKAANSGHDVIMTPHQWMYLDKYQGEDKLNPVSIGGFLDLEKVYNYHAVSSLLRPENEKHVLGVQANVWTEYMYSEKVAEWRIYPRLIALSEVGWTNESNKDFNDFNTRLNNQKRRLDFHGVNYYIPIPENDKTPSSNYVTFTDKAILKFKKIPEVQFIYTTDQSEPGRDALQYDNPLHFTTDTTLKIRSLLSHGKLGPVRTIEIKKESLLDPAETATAKTGLRVAYYFKEVRNHEVLSEFVPDKKELVSDLKDIKPIINRYDPVGDNYCATVIQGFLVIPEDGVYYFNTDDELWIGDTQLISQESLGESARRFTGNDKSIALAKGLHPFKYVQLGTIFGGWPTQWNPLEIKLRKENETAFKTMDARYFY